jgi:crossover junction endodeoxyribonuclease RuvC
VRLADLLGGGKGRAARQREMMDRRGPVTILGIDPGLGTTGWGVIRREGSRLTHLDNGEISTNADAPLGNRLVTLADALEQVFAAFQPDAVAVEEVFVNKNAQSTLKLAQARGVVLLAAARSKAPITEYAAKLVKKCVVGTGRADKAQIQAMLRTLLPGFKLTGPDAADALAVAITHAHHG